MAPTVSVLMPTYRQREFIRRAVTSLMAQTYTDWELVIVDDGSPDDVRAELGDLLRDGRIRFHRNARNTGLGDALNQATALAGGRYIAYLPSDDVYHRRHLELLVDALEADAGRYLAYGGVQTGYSSISPDDPDWRHGATLRGDDVVGREADVLADTPPAEWPDTFKSGNILALVQVGHRRSEESSLPWTTRAEKTSDTIEADQWRSMLARGLRFAYTGEVTCQWTQHPHQRHRIIGGRPGEFGRMVGGLAFYRSWYGIPAGQYLNWQPAQGFKVDERTRSAPLAERYSPARISEPGLRILIVGDLGFNPERLLLMERDGHRLAGLWTHEPELWMVTGPFPWGDIRDIGFTDGWADRVREFAPDVIFAGLGWPSMPLAHAVLTADLGVPFVLQFKEGPGYLHRHGLWPMMYDLMTRSDGLVFFNDEYRAWFAAATGGRVGGPDGHHITQDGELPLREWFTDEVRPKLSAAGEVHTVCTGRWLCPEPWSEFVAAGVHVHLYGEVFHDLAYGHIPAGVDTGYVHLHPTVQPADWVRELSQYDAGWLHIFDSRNQGDPQASTWSDLNYPGRLSTYASAGLPWIMRSNAARGSVTAVENLAAHYRVGIGFRTIAELGEQLADRNRTAELGDRMWAARDQFTFDAHLDDLVRFFRTTIDRAGRNR